MAASVFRQPSGLTRNPGVGMHTLGSAVNSGPTGVMMTSDGCAPEDVMMMSDRTQAPGLANDAVSWISVTPLATFVLTCPCWRLTGAVKWAGGSRCGRTKFGIRTWTATNATSVTAIG